MKTLRRQTPKGLTSKKTSVKFRIAKGTKIDYKDISQIRKHLNDRGKIIPRRFTGATAKEQRLITRELNKARYLGLLPVSSERTQRS